MLSKEVAVPGAFLDFGLGFCDRFAHLKHSKPRQLGLVVAQVARDAVQVFRSLSKRGCTPLQKGLMRLVEGFVDLALVVWLKCFQHLSGGGIDRLNAHYSTPIENKIFTRTLLYPIEYCW